MVRHARRDRRHAIGGRPALPVVAACLLPLLCGLPAAVRAQDAAGHTVAPAAIEGRPGPADTSPLQALIDRAPAGTRLEVPPGTYVGDIVIDKPLTLTGARRPRLVGSGGGSVVRVRAADVTVEGFDIDGLGGGDLGRDSSGIHVAGARATIRDCAIANTLFGVYLYEADGSVIENCRIRGIPGKDPGEKGSGIHAFNTLSFRFVGNDIADVRDGLYLQNSSKGTVRRNTVRDVRYGLHYMFSDDNTFEDNLFMNGAAGSAIMYSERIVFRRNRFLRNRGFASVGLLLQQCDDVVAESNLIADNARGIFLEGTQRARFSGNIVAKSDVAIVAFDSATATRFEGNSFVGNMSPLMLVGRRLDATFDGNYWSGHREPDLDGDGRTERPYRLVSVFDHLRSNLTAADLFVDGFAASALALAETAFPVLSPATVVEAAPLARAPRLADVPAPDDAGGRMNGPGIAMSGFLLFGGALVLSAGRRAGHVPCGGRS
jgi:nitrous oxidase accessory protein